MLALVIPTALVAAMIFVLLCPEQTEDLLFYFVPKELRPKNLNLTLGADHNDFYFWERHVSSSTKDIREQSDSDPRFISNG